MIAGLTAVFALGACGSATDAVSKGAQGAIESATGCKVDAHNDKNTKVECKGKNGSRSELGIGLTTDTADHLQSFPLTRLLPILGARPASARSSDSESCRRPNGLADCRFDGPTD